MKTTLLVLSLALCAHLCVGQLSQWGSFVSLSQVLDQNHYSTFPGDPNVNITIFNTIADDGYKLERINSLGTHTGTHMSAPCHFFPQSKKYKCIDELPASAFVFTAALIDVSRIAAVRADPTHKITWNEIKQYERTVMGGQIIPEDAIVMLFTGLSSSFGDDEYANTPVPGFSTECVYEMVKQRGIKGLGSDTFGPDASDDENFEGSTAIYEKGGITIENMANLKALKGRRFGDIIVATPARLKNGSGYQTNVIAFLKR